jgi:hypothetical protein
MPRSILAMRSWWRMTIAVIEIAPPTRMATIGISSGPKPVIESINLIRRLLHSPSFLVELTGIEPVASWLQTRRSPS